MRAARGVHVVGAGVVRALQRRAAGARLAGRGGAGTGARARSLCGARAPRVARAHRRPHHRAHGRRRLPDCQGCNAVVSGRRVRMASAVAERARRDPGRLRARVRRLAARHASAHRTALRTRHSPGAGRRGGDAVHGGGAVCSGRVAVAHPAPWSGGRRAMSGPFGRHAVSGPEGRRAAGGAGAAVRGSVRAAVRRGGHPLPDGRAGGVRARGVLRAAVGGVVRAVRARRRAVALRGAPRGAVRSAALAGHALVDGVRGARHVPAAGRVRGAHASAAAGGAGAQRPRPRRR